MDKERQKSIGTGQCADYQKGVRRCVKGMGVTPLYRLYFCESMPERCPLRRGMKADNRVLESGGMQ